MRILALSLLLFATQAHADPELAVGGTRALAGVAGPALTWDVTDALAIDTVAGVAHSDGATPVGVEIGVRWTLARRGAAALSAGVRGGFARADHTDTLFELPARLELAVTPWLRVHVEGGFALSYAISATTWKLGGNGVAAGAGFGVIF